MGEGSTCAMDDRSKSSVLGDGGNQCHRRASLEDSRRVRRYAKCFAPK
ncbi:MAG: hypothetical protein U0269_15215 [Polyangiales bacterium]